MKHLVGNLLFTNESLLKNKLCNISCKHRFVYMTNIYFYNSELNHYSRTKRRYIYIFLQDVICSSTEALNSTRIIWPSAWVGF